jgi:hypothetical protein
MPARPVKTYRGSYHCGAVQFEIQTDFPELTTCDCSMCRRRGVLMVKVHESAFQLLSGSAYGVNVCCLEGFDPSGIPIRATAGAKMA